jgi:RHS repeat-associated protein
LIADQQEEIAEIKWNVQGKVQEIKRTANSKKSDLLFKYDAMGNRVSKTEIYPKAIEDVQSITTYYVRDAQGNVMAVYNEKKYEDGKIDLSLTEQHLYGSSRLGMRQVNELLVEKDEIKEFDQAYSSRNLGEKSYELSNHLGNVLAVVSDKKKADGTADVVAVYDYYPFGMTMPGRSLSGDYRYGFGGHEKDDEVKGNGNHISFGDYGYDPRISRRWRPDPIDQIFISNYAGFANNPIILVDPDGRTVVITGGEEEQQSAFQQTQTRVANELSLTMENGGNITATQTITGPLTAESQQLMDAISSTTITVNITAISGNTDANGNLVVAGSFDGNTVTLTPDGNAVVANQTVIPKVLEKMSNAAGTPGQDMLHEITEAFQGALITQPTGVGVGVAKAANPNSVYDRAHNSAVPQSGEVTEIVYGGTPIMYPITRSPWTGKYSEPITKVEWSVINTSGEKVIIQKLQP